MPGRGLTTIARRDLQDGGSYQITEAVTEVGAAAPQRKVALFDEQSLRMIRVAYSDESGTVNFPWLASDGRPLLLVAFDPDNEYASPTVRRTATLTGERP